MSNTGWVLMICTWTAVILVMLGCVIRLTRAPKKPDRQCPNADCGHLNAQDARFCARCGRELPPARQEADEGGSGALSDESGAT